MREPSRDERALVERAVEWIDVGISNCAVSKTALGYNDADMRNLARIVLTNWPHITAAITSLSQEVEDGRIAIAGLNSDWNVAMRRAEAAERRLEEVRAETIEACAKIAEKFGDTILQFYSRGPTSPPGNQQRAIRGSDIASAIRSKSGASDV